VWLHDGDPVFDASGDSLAMVFELTRFLCHMNQSSSSSSSMHVRHLPHVIPSSSSLCRSGDIFGRGLKSADRAPWVDQHHYVFRESNRQFCSGHDFDAYSTYIPILPYARLEVTVGSNRTPMLREITPATHPQEAAALLFEDGAAT